MNSDIIKANIKVHTRMADEYNNEPHFRPENKAKVKKILTTIRKQGGDKLLDIGCGTGFIIDLAKDLFAEIHGVDVTQAMLDKVDISTGNITLHNTAAEQLPFKNAYFDVVTSYSFIHHVEDYRPILQEAYRVLKPGGTFYIDLEPNKYFWKSMVKMDSLDEDRKSLLPDIILREINSVLYTDVKVEEEFGIEKDLFNKAEYIKNILGGIDPYEFQDESKRIGFSQCKVDFQWFIGQATVMHGKSFEQAQEIEDYLNTVIAMTNHLFKYLRFTLVK